MAQNDSEWPILSDSQLFQSFPTEVAQNDSEQPILPNSQLFQSFPTTVAQDNLEWPNLPDLQLFQSLPTEVAQNDSEWPILPNSQLFQSFSPEVAQNDSEQAIGSLPQTINLVVYPKLPIWQFALAGGGVNYQMQITKLVVWGIILIIIYLTYIHTMIVLTF